MPTRGPVLRGRRAERRAIQALIGDVGAGRSGVLVLRGEAGVGKTALLEFAAREAPEGFRVERIRGVESEMELPFAGLHQLCAPMLEQLGRLPAPQRYALSAAFGLSEGGRPDRFLVALAALSLISEVGERRPLVCLIDDAQWLDGVSAQALAFVARRLLAEPVGLLFAVREPADEFGGLPELRVEGLPERDARALLQSVVRGKLDDRVRDRLVAETRGNPLALIELPRGLTTTELAGGFSVPAVTQLSGRIEQSFVRRLDQLPEDTRMLVLVAAADPLGDPALLWRASQELGIGLEALAPAEAQGFLTVGAGVEFDHPLVRSAVYGQATPGDRRSAHAALAAASDPGTDPDHRAWHRSQAATGPDEDVASELERSAERALARGGLAAAAAILERATALTVDPARRTRRALTAAEATYRAGRPEPALQMLATLDTATLGELERALADRLRAQISFTLRRGPVVPELLIGAARRLAPLDPARSRTTYLEAMEAMVYTGRFCPAGGVRAIADAAAAAPPPPGEPGPVDLLLDGLVALVTDGYAASAPLLQRALAELQREDTPADVGSRWLWLAGHVAVSLWDDDAWHALTQRQIATSRDTGALSVLPFALNSGAGLLVLSGEFSEAEALVEEARAISALTGSPTVSHAAPVTAAWRGDREQTERVVEEALADATAQHDGRQLSVAEWATAVLRNGTGEYRAALISAQAAVSRDELGITERALPEVIEAAVRARGRSVAEAAFAELTARTTVSGTSWALGVRAQCEALLSRGERADRCYREAIEHLDRSRIASQGARARLLYGEWLRRERRRVEARDQLQLAHDAFAAMGAAAFAERARVELLATGAQVDERRDEAGAEELTPQESQVARLAAQGASNQAIGAQLFISPSTVAYHLRKVFRKLDISSRHQLGEVLVEHG